MFYVGLAMIKAIKRAILCMLSTITELSNKNLTFAPVVGVEVSGGILEANANRDVKYIAHITLSAASPAASIDGETPRASETAT